MQESIGIFDSGLGGLTVAHAIREAFPGESLVYLGDTARVPYGTRSATTVERYALACAQHLMQSRLKLLVVACNTASAVALGALRAALPIPVLGVIDPGAEAGLRASRSKRIGVLATQGTARSGAYRRAISQLDSTAFVLEQPAPLLVPLAEEGWLAGDVPRLAARRYLAPLAKAQVDTVVLGCTHYPLFAELLTEEARALMGAEVVVVDSARATAAALAKMSPGLSASPSLGSLRLLVTDLPDSFEVVAKRFLGDALPPGGVEQVDLKPLAEG